MAKKDKVKIIYCCKKCGYIPPKDENLSNKNWVVTTIKTCPNCGEKLGIKIE